MSCKRRIKVKDKPCKYYISSGVDGEAGFCELPSEFRCIEAVRHCAPRLSFSAVNNWCKCRYCYYLNQVKGVQTQDHMKSNPLKMGGIWDKVWNEIFLHGVIDLSKMANIIRIESEKEQLGEKETQILLALLRGIHHIGFTPPHATPQVLMQYLIAGKMNLIGYADGIMENKMLFEVKLSSKPDYYTTLFNIHDQVGTYFLAEKRLEKVVMLVTRVPWLKSVKRFEDEDAEEHGARVFKDVCKRPSHYFQGWDNKTKKFGKVFYRGEFDLDELRDKYVHIAREIPEAVKLDAMYQEKGNCMSPFKCDYMDICISGGVSEGIYRVRSDKPKGGGA